VIDWLQSDLTSLALCWRLDRRDGVTLGFTSHDRDLVIGGIVYRAAPGMLPSAVRTTDGLDADTLDVSGALTADAITEADLAAGRWDGARLRLFAVDWSDPSAAPVVLARGEIGDVQIADGGFSAELSGPAALLDVPAVEATSPECRADLGDTRCRVDLAPRTQLRTVTAASGTSLTLDAAEPSVNGWGYGRLRWLDGPNTGLTAIVAASSGASVELREPPPFAVTIGTRLEIVEGCDRSAQTCRNRFANIANFRAEPFLPGNDLLTRYPGQ